MTRAVLFDLDGTLVDTAPEIALALERTFGDIGVALLTPGHVRDLIGRGVPALIERALEQAGATDVDLSPTVARFETHYAGTIGTLAELFTGVREGIDLLHAHGVPMGVVTNKPRFFTERLLERFGLRARLALVITGDDGHRRKPEGDMLKAACAGLGSPPRQTVMVGDSDNDVVAARHAGCSVWCVPYGYNEGRPPEALACDRLVATVLEAARLVTGQVDARVK